MGVPTSEVGYTSAMPRREGPRSRQKGHVVVLGKKKNSPQFSNKGKELCISVLFVRI